MPTLRRLLIASVLVVVGVAVSPAQVSVSTGFDYTRGDYGLGEDTEILAIPFSATLVTDRWIWRASLPYLRVSGPAHVLPELGQVGVERPENTTESGFGDLVFAGTYALDTRAGRPAFDFTGKIKLGTADEGKGLGTGGTDIHGQVDIFHVLGNWAPYATLGYRVLGDSPELQLENGFYVSLGASYRWSEPTRVGAVLDWRQRAVRGGDDALELTVYVTHRLTTRWRLQGYLVAGASDASPDSGVGGVIGYDF